MIAQTSANMSTSYRCEPSLLLAKQLVINGQMQLQLLLQKSNFQHLLLSLFLVCSWTCGPDPKCIADSLCQYQNSRSICQLQTSNLMLEAWYYFTVSVSKPNRASQNATTNFRIRAGPIPTGTISRVCGYESGRCRCVCCHSMPAAVGPIVALCKPCLIALIIFVHMTSWFSQV